MLEKISKKNAVEIVYYSTVPLGGSTLNEQLDNCYAQLSHYLKSQGLLKTNIVKQTIFVANTDILGYLKDKKKIIDISLSFFQAYVPTSIVPQPPLNGSLVAIEFALIPTNDNIEIRVKKTGKREYLLILAPQYTQLIAGGLGIDNENTDIYVQSMEAFEQMHSILSAENMDFSHIIRQWNYIEDIVGYSEKNQHYQIFNDVRSAFYNNSRFNHGYPSATGIGMETGGVIIDFIAIREKKGISIIPIKSPVQTDAHQYSKQVIAHNFKVSGTAETTPKFERAKAIVSGNSCLVHISGTSAIKGQFSLDTSDAATQTCFTIESIYQLVSYENLQKHGIRLISSKTLPCYFRVYVKNPSDFNAVKTTCEKYINNVQAIYLKADICRPELLIEVEGVFLINF